MELSLERQNEGRSTRRDATGCRWGQGQAASHVPDPALCLHTRTHALKPRGPRSQGQGLRAVLSPTLPTPMPANEVASQAPGKVKTDGQGHCRSPHPTLTPLSETFYTV